MPYLVEIDTDKGCDAYSVAQNALPKGHKKKLAKMNNTFLFDTFFDFCNRVHTLNPDFVVLNIDKETFAQFEKNMEGQFFIAWEFKRPTLTVACDRT
ncbi:hypothetical protein [Terasakiella sp.]|uniref:hypothetical protein n=1 Tax=Terasakiella sp. TaxID=2034861 RepID=UPI003AA7FE3F